MIDERIHIALSATGQKVYQLVAQQDESLPFTAFGVETEAKHHKDGIAIYTTALIVYCCAETIAAVVSAGNAVIAALASVPDVELCQFRNRATTAETEEGKAPIYIETLTFNLKHITP